MNDRISYYLESFRKIRSSYERVIAFYDKENTRLETSLNFYKQRCELLQQVQKYMRDPERTIVCDILANNSLLPDPEGKRYSKDLKTLIGETE
jgi:exonuclease VII small subunit